jgi:hypothetical protein
MVRYIFNAPRDNFERTENAMQAALTGVSFSDRFAMRRLDGAQIASSSMDYMRTTMPPLIRLFNELFYKFGVF